MIRLQGVINNKLAHFKRATQQNLSNKPEYDKIHTYQHISQYDRKKVRFQNLKKITTNYQKVSQLIHIVTRTLCSIERVLQTFPKKQILLIEKLCQMKLDFSIKFNIVDNELEYIQTLKYCKSARKYLKGFKAYYICVHFTWFVDTQKNIESYIPTSIYPILMQDESTMYGKYDKKMYVTPHYNKMSVEDEDIIRDMIYKNRSLPGRMSQFRNSTL